MNRKSKFQLIKKAFVQIDFAFAIFLFLFFFIIIYTYYINSLESYDLTSIDSNFIADSNDICKLLITTPGVPNNWETDITKLKTLGILKINKSFIDPSKISVFTFSNYINITNSLNLKKILNIKITGLNSNTIYLDFGFNTTNKISNHFSNYNCYSNYNNLEPVKIKVEVWD